MLTNGWLPVRLQKWIKWDCRLEQRIQVIVSLSRRRDCLLASPALDLPALEALAADYESVRLVYAAAELRGRLEWYREV